jgi:hypothetical protein
LKILRIVALVLAGLVLTGLGVYAWAWYASDRKLSRSVATHAVDFPIPFPVSEQQVQNRRLAGDPERSEGSSQNRVDPSLRSG